MQGYQWVSAWTGSGPPSHQLLALTEEFQALQQTQQQQAQQQQQNDEALVEQVAYHQRSQQIQEADARAWFEKWMALQSLKPTGHR